MWEAPCAERSLLMGKGWRADLTAIRWDRKKSRVHPMLARPSAGCPCRSAMCTAAKAEGDLCRTSPLPMGPGLLVTGGLSQPEAGPTPARPATCTRQPRGYLLLAALVRGVQTEALALTSLLTGVFALGKTGREESTGDSPPASPRHRGQPAGGPTRTLFSWKREDGDSVQTGLPEQLCPRVREQNCLATSCVTGDTHFLLDLLQRCQGSFNCPGEAHPSPLCHGGDCGVPSVVGGKNGGKEATTKMTQRARVGPHCLYLLCPSTCPRPCPEALRST